MPRYRIRDNDSGRTLVVEGDAPPTEADASALFAQAPAKPAAEAKPEPAPDLSGVKLDPYQQAQMKGDHLKMDGHNADFIAAVATDAVKGFPEVRQIAGKAYDKLQQWHPEIYGDPKDSPRLPEFQREGILPSIGHFLGDSGRALLGLGADLAENQKPGEWEWPNLNQVLTELHSSDQTPLPTEQEAERLTGGSRFVAKAGQSFVKFVPRLEASLALGAGGASAPVAASAPMAVTDEGKVDPVGALIAAGLPGVSKAGEKLATDILTRLPVSNLQFQWAKTLGGELYPRLEAITQKIGGLEFSSDLARKFFEKGGGLVAANTYLLAASAPDILAMPEDQRAQGTLDLTATLLAPSLLGFTSRTGKSEAFKRADANARAWWTEAKARYARAQAAPKLAAEPPPSTEPTTPPAALPVPAAPAPPASAATPPSPSPKVIPTAPPPTAPPAEPAPATPKTEPSAAVPAPVVPAPAPVPEPVVEGQAVIGKETFVKGANNTTLPARYAWLPLDQIQSSHVGETFALNPAYAPIKNTRDYDRDPAEQEKVILGANDFDALSYAVNVKGAAEGPLMVAPANDGRYRVLGGNGRKQMLDRLPPAKRRELGQIQDTEAAAFGLPPRPSDRHVLVRLLPGIDVQTPAGVEAANRLVDVLNPSAGLIESTAKLAENDALKLSPALLRDITPQTGTGLKREFIAGLIGNGTLDRNTRSRLLKSDDELEDYVTRLVTHAAYRNPAVVATRANPKTSATINGLIDGGTPLLQSLREIGDQADTVADSFGQMIQRVDEYQKQFPDKKLNLILQMVADQMEMGAGADVKLAQQLAMVLAHDVEFIEGRSKRGQPIKQIHAEETVRNFAATLDRITKSVRAWQRDGGAGADIFGASRTLTESVSDALKLMGMTSETGAQIAEPGMKYGADKSWRFRSPAELREGDLFSVGGQVKPVQAGLALPAEVYSLAADGKPGGPDPRVRRYRQLMQQMEAGKLTPAQQQELNAVEAALGQRFIADWNEIATRPDAPTPDAFARSMYQGFIEQRIRRDATPAEKAEATRYIERLERMYPSLKVSQSEMNARLQQRLTGADLVTQRELLDKPGQMSFFERKQDYENAVASGKPLTPQQVEFGFALGLDSLGRLPAEPAPRPDADRGTRFEIPALAPFRTRLLKRTASLVKQEILTHGKLDIQGQLCRNVEEAAVLMQAFRLRQMEIFHWVMVKDGRVVGHYAMTTRRPNSTVSWEGGKHDFIRTELQRLGADGYYVVHNHPSGKPDPSEADIRATINLNVRGSQFHVPGFLGHIIIDHTKYAVINEYGSHAVYDLKMQSFEHDPLLYRGGGGLNKQFATLDSDRLAEWGRQWTENKPNQITFLFVDARGRTVAITDADANELQVANYTDFIHDLRSFALNHGAAMAFAYHDGKNDTANFITNDLVRSGVIEDAMVPGYSSLRATMLPSELRYPRDHWFGLRDGNPVRLADDQKRYQADTFSSKGLYAQGTPVKPGRVPPKMKVTLGGMTHVKPVEMPELVKLVREWMGELPKLKKMPKARGVFKSGGPGSIALDPRIFENEVDAAKTLAHEIGHWADYMPDHMLKRGNVLGRLYTLRNFLKNQFGSGGVTNKEYRDELLKLTQYWKPYNPATDPASYVKYRESAVELYADALSVLLNSPGLLEQMAPKFYSRFWMEIDRKPEVREALFGLQDFLSKGKVPVIEARRGEIQQGFQKGEQLYRQAVADRKARAKDLRGFITALDQAFGDRFAPVVKLANDSNPAGRIIAPKGDIRALLEELQMRDVLHLRFARAVDEGVRQPLEAAGLNLTTLGEYMLYQRIFQGDRAGLANPGGITPSVARQHLLMMRNELGMGQVTLLDAATKKFHSLVFDVMQEATDVGIINREVFNTTVVPNKEFYAAFVPLKYVADYVPPGIKKQIGTLENIANPFLSTVLKTFALQNAIVWQRAKLGTVKMLQADFPGDIAEAKMRGAYPHEFPVEEPGKGLLSVMVDGRPKWFTVDPYIAEAFDRMHPGQTNNFVRLASALLDKPFRELVYPLIIGYNPSFMLFMSPARDFLRTSRNLRSLGVKFARTKLLAEYWNAYRTARQRFTGNSLALIREMEANFALGTPFDVLARLNRPGDDAWAEILSQRGLTSTLEHKKLIEKYWLEPMQRALVPFDLMAAVVDQGLHKLGLPESVNPVRGLVHPLDAIEFNGMSLDISPKIGAYRILRREGLSPREAAAVVRNYAGLPNIYRKGTWHAVPRALVPFWNVFLQGTRADLKLMTSPQTRSGWWWHFLTTEGAVAVLKGLAAAGVFGYALKKMYDGISEYQKTNYNVIPLGLMPGGDFGNKVVFGRIPMDETARVPAAILYKLTQLMAERPDQYKLPTDLFAFGAGQLPTFNPVLNVGARWADYAGGVQPRDAHTGQRIVSDREWSAGGWDSLAPMFLWTAEQSGAMNLVRFDPRAETTWAMTVSAIPGLNKVLMTTDYGYLEQQRAVKQAEQRAADKEFLKLPVPVQGLHAEYGRLQRIGDDARTPAQQARYEELNQWYSSTFRPAVETIHELEAAGLNSTAESARKNLLSESQHLKQK